MTACKWLLSVGIFAAWSPALTSAGDDDGGPAARLEGLAGRYEFFADASRKVKFDRERKPLLKYANPVRGEVSGNVFVWTHQGRPEVIGAVFDYRTERTLYSELHTLARAGTVGHRDGKEFWTPSEPGAKFQAVPRGPTPAESDKSRLLQARELARGFAVERTHPEHGKEAMRLLPSPIFRYASPATGTLDGAIFAFADATTDPEAFLLLEASGGDKPGWQFAFVRMNIVEFRAEYQGEFAWGVPAVDWATVYDRHEPYAIVRETPPRGLVRKP